MASVDKLTSALNSMKLNSKNVKEEKDFVSSVVSTVSAEPKALGRILPTLLDLVSD
jgi:hypothetical protein